MNIQPKPKSEIDSLRPCCDGNQGPVVGRWGAVLLMAFVSCPFLHGETLEKQITFAPHGHILTNWATWSPDSQWLVYDIRSDPAGDRFDGTRIERVNVATGETQVLFRTDHGAYCGVATTCPADGKIVFIHGPENPGEHWQYGAFHRRGVLVDTKQPGKAANLDARNLVAPYTAGALRGGTHVHTFSRDGQWVSFTYEDHVLAEVSNSESGLGSASGLGSSKAGPDAGDVEQRDLNQRNVGVSVPHDGVSSPKSHPRNHDGTHFTVLVTRTENSPKPGSDEIDRAFSDAWVGHAGYIKSDGSRQRRAIAFQGHVRTSSGETISEVFVVDIPEDVTVAANDGPLQGTQTQRPMPPQGTRQRRLTYTQDRAYPGLQGARHWLRSSPDGAKIAFLMKDDAGVSQLWIISPNGGSPKQLTHNTHPVGSAFSWSSDGAMIAHAMDQSVCVTRVDTGNTVRLTQRRHGQLRPEACVFSPDDRKVAYVRHVPNDGDESEGSWNQIFVLDVKAAMAAGQ